MIIKTQFGLGDCLYLRPILRFLPHSNLYLETCWPQAFIDMPNIKFIKPKDHKFLRTQSDNVEDSVNFYTNDGYVKPDVTLSYNLDHGTILDHYCKQVLGYQPKWVHTGMILPKHWPLKAQTYLPSMGSKKLCLIRPNTLRNEWLCPARNPKTEYIQRFIDLHKKDFFIVSIANLMEGQEVYDGKLTSIDMEITSNLPIEALMGMFQIADVIITSPSFWVPLGLALGSNMLVIYGGHESHYRINDKRLGECAYIQPFPFDRCEKEHPNAFKTISLNMLDTKFEELLNRCSE